MPGIPGYFPKKFIGISEISGIATPVRRLSRLHDTAPRSDRILEKLVRLAGRTDIAGHGKPGETRPLGRDPGVSRQQLSGVERQPDPADVEEDHALRRGDPGKPESGLVKPGRSIQVRDAKGDKADPRLHLRYSPVICCHL